MEELELKTKLQTIYYKYPNDTLGIAYATSDKRITLQEATTILNRRDINYSEILKVKYETMDMKISSNDFEKYIK